MNLKQIDADELVVIKPANESQIEFERRLKRSVDLLVGRLNTPMGAIATHIRGNVEVVEVLVGVLRLGLEPDLRLRQTHYRALP